MSAASKSATVTVARGAVIILAGLASARLLNWAYRIVLARSGGMAEFGVLFMALSTIAVAGSIASLGLEYGVARYLPLYQGKDNRAGLRACLRFSLLLALASGSVAAALLYLAAAPLARGLFDSPALVEALRLSALCLPFYVTGRVLVKTVVAFQKIEYRVTVYQFFNPLLKLLLTLLLLTFGLGALGAIQAYLAAEAASSLALWLILEKKICPVLTGPRLEHRPSFNPKQYLAYSLPLFLAGFLDVAMNYTDVFMTGHFLDAQAVGLYGAAATLASLVAVGTELINPMFLSIITRQWAGGDNESIIASFNNNNRWFLYLTLPLLAGAALMAGPLMGLVWGQPFQAGAAAFVLLTAGRFFFCIENTSLMLLSMHGAAKFLLISNVSVAGLNVVLNWWLIPLMGINGAALATCISLAFHAALAMANARRYHRGQGMRVFYWMILLAAALPAGIFILLPECLGHGWFGMLSSGILYSICFVALLLAFRVFSPEDRQVWQAVLRWLHGPEKERP